MPEYQAASPPAWRSDGGRASRCRPAVCPQDQRDARSLEGQRRGIRHCGRRGGQRGANLVPVLAGPDRGAGSRVGSMPDALPRLYDDLAAWWSLLSPPSEYETEAADLLPRLGPPLDSRPATLLELGSGGGSLAFHLKSHFRMTLTDRAPAMLAVSGRSTRSASTFSVICAPSASAGSSTSFSRTTPSCTRRSRRPSRPPWQRPRCIAVPGERSPCSPISCARRSSRRPTMVGTTTATARAPIPRVGLGPRPERRHLPRRLRLPFASRRRQRNRGTRPTRGGPLRSHALAGVVRGSRHQRSLLTRPVGT